MRQQLLRRVRLLRSRLDNRPVRAVEEAGAVRENTGLGLLPTLFSALSPSIVETLGLRESGTG